MKAKGKPLKQRPAKPLKKENLTTEYPARLAELEAELTRYLIQAVEPSKYAIQSVTKLGESEIGDEKVVQFSCDGEIYFVGHSDRTYAATNHARGVRHIRFYDNKQTMILAIAGDFEAQEFGSNFQFRNLHTFVPGEWETAFLKLTDQLRAYRADKKEEFRKRRASDKQISNRGHSRF